MRAAIHPCCELVIIGARDVSYTFPMRMDRGCRSTSIVRKWSFLALEAEIPNPADFKSTFVGDTPVVGRDSKQKWVAY
jgi:phenylpropionate dioxygenase-like ring-hydroxylating dioxygenase large terminal subunit